MRYLTAIRTASSAQSKQSPGVAAATTGTGISEFRPYSTMRRSACSGFVGIPVDGPARCTSMITSGSSSVTAEADGLGLEHDARTGRRAHTERAAEARAERGADGRDLVLGLERPHAEVLVVRELLEDRRRGRDRVRTEEERQLRLRRSRDQPVCERLVARDLPVEPGRERRRLHLVLDGKSSDVSP